MIEEYNNKVKQLSPDHRNPSPFPEDMSLNDLLLADSALWELDRLNSNDKWAYDPITRNAIASLYDSMRLKEEIDILCSQCQRCINWHCENLDDVENALKFVPENCRVQQLLLQHGQVSAEVLLAMGNLNSIVRFLQKSKRCAEEISTEVKGFSSRRV